MKKRTKIIIASLVLLLFILGGYTLNGNRFVSFKIPLSHDKKVKEVPFKEKKDPNILRISQQLNNEKITEKNELLARSIQLFQHKPKDENDFYTCYINIPVAIQAKFLSVIFYDSKLKHLYEIPAKKLSDKTFVIQTRFFKQLQKTKYWHQVIVFMTDDGNYQYRTVKPLLNLPTKKDIQLNAQLPSQQFVSKPINLFTNIRLKSIVQSLQHKTWYDYFQQQQIGFEKSDKVATAIFDYSSIDDGKFSCLLQLASIPAKHQNFRLAIWQQKQTVSELHQYPFQQVGSREFIVNFNNSAHNNYAEGKYIGYLLSNHSTSHTTSATLLSQTLFIPKYILKIIDYQIIPQNAKLGIYQINLILNKNERVHSTKFDVWTKHKGKDDLVSYVTNGLSREQSWQQVIDIRKVHFDDTIFVIKVSVDLDLTGEKEMGELQMSIDKHTSPIYVNHRGQHQLAPENSIPAFKQSNYEAIETDIHLTADKKWVVLHDDTLNRTTNGNGEISQYLFGQLLNIQLKGIGVEQYASNELKIPTLEDYLMICKSKGKIPIIEIKTETIDLLAYQELIDLLRNYQLSHIVRFISFHYQPLKEIKKLMPECAVMYLNKKLNQEVISQAKKLGSRAGVNVFWESLNEANVTLAHQNGLQVGAWTVPFNQFANMERLGVDYITTNDA